MFSRSQSVSKKFHLQNKRSNATVAKYDSFGYPTRVLKIEAEPVPEITNNSVHVKMLYAPMNVDDMNAISGRYGVRQTLPAVAGNDGLGKVVSVGKGVKSVKAGDYVVPATFGIGSWRTAGVFEEEQVLPVQANGVDEVQLATASHGPLIAYRILNDFVQLNKGDVIILNGASSATGQAIIQLAHSRGLKTICVVRNECFQNAATVQYLGEIGATVIIDEKSVSTHTFRRQISDLPAPKLAIDSVGGKSSTEMSRLIENGGTLVIFGGTSPAPVVIPTQSLIFKDVSFRGFFLTRWLNETSNEEKSKALSTIIDLHKQGVFRVQQEHIPFDQFGKALEKSLSFSTSKIVLKM